MHESQCVVCLNPRLAEERARKREDLLKDTEAILGRIAGIVRRKGSKLRGLRKSTAGWDAKPTGARWKNTSTSR